MVARRRPPMPRLRARPHPPAREVAARALRLVCPRCGRTRLYRTYFAMHEGCEACGLRYEREQGYFVGAIYVNYAVTAAVAVGGVLGLDWLVGLTLARQLALGIVLGALVPLVVFRYARSVWLAAGYLVARAEERWERSRQRSR